MKFVVLLVALAGVALPPLPAAGDTTLAFEAASVKPSSPTSGTEIRRYPGGRFTATGVTLKALIQRAWDVKDFQIAGVPGWANSERYDVIAKAPTSGDPTDAQLMAMIRALLADRFQLRIHHETRDLPIYSLVPGKTGAKLMEDTTAPGSTWSRGPGTLTGIRVTMATFAGDMLEAQLGRVVVNNTGMKGEFDVKLEWTPDPDPSPGSETRIGPSIFTAIQEQLGLKLESQKGPVDVIVVDSAEKPTEN